MSADRFDRMLSGGHPNSLGRTAEVVDLVMSDRRRLPALFACLDSEDELVRMRAGDALEKVCRERVEWFVPYVNEVLDRTGRIEQPSVQWHVAQIRDHLRQSLSEDQRRRSTSLLQRNLETSNDWIVLNVTMDVLAAWARDDQAVARWLEGELVRLSSDPRKSVAKRAGRHLAALGPR